MKRSIAIISIMIILTSILQAQETSSTATDHYLPLKVEYTVNPDKFYYEKGDIINISATFTYPKDHQHYNENEYIGVKIEGYGSIGLKLVADVDSLALNSQKNTATVNFKLVAERICKGGVLAGIYIFTNKAILYPDAYKYFTGLNQKQISELGRNAKFRYNTFYSRPGFWTEYEKKKFCTIYKKSPSPKELPVEWQRRPGGGFKRYNLQEKRTNRLMLCNSEIMLHPLDY